LLELKVLKEVKPKNRFEKWSKIISDSVDLKHSEDTQSAGLHYCVAKAVSSCKTFKNDHSDLHELCRSCLEKNAARWIQIDKARIRIGSLEQTDFTMWEIDANSGVKVDLGSFRSFAIDGKSDGLKQAAKTLAEAVPNAVVAGYPAFIEMKIPKL
jgi:hypothetical protein